MWVTGYSRSVKLVPFESFFYGFLFALRSNYGAILYCLRDIATYWSKIAIFFVPYLYLAPPQAVTPSE